MDRLKDKVAIATAAGSGIGRASAILFAKEGAKVLVMDIDSATGEDTVKAIKDAGGEASFFQGDVSKVSDMELALLQNTRKMAFHSFELRTSRGGLCNRMIWRLFRKLMHAVLRSAELTQET